MMALLANDPADRAEQLITLSERLTALLDQETAAFNEHRPGLPRDLADEKTRLANNYRLELTRIAADRSLIAPAPVELRGQLEVATRTLQAAVKENARAVLKVKAVSEGLVKAIGDEIAKNRASPIGYGPRLGGRPNTGDARAITLDRNA
jgi:ABC-type transporter Mla subunit MlaD